MDNKNVKETANYEIESVKESLGNDYKRAITWYRLLHPEISKMKVENYKTMENQWKLILSVSNMIETDEENNISTCTVEEKYLEKTFRLFSSVFNGPKIIPDEDTMRKYIADCLDTFKQQTVSEVLHKNSISLLKMSMEDIEFDIHGNAVFDSSKASTFMGGTIDKKTNGSNMRWVLSSEDGISRLLDKYGKSQVIVFMGTTAKTDEEAMALHEAKVNIFKKGITDVHTGKHYMCSAPSASSTRHADFPFIEADTPEDVYKIWCEITGFKDIDSLVKGIGKNKDGKVVVNLAKLKARIAMRGSNSFDTYKTVSNEDVLYRLKHPRVDYVRDAKGETCVPYKGITAPGVLEMKNPDGTITSERV